MSIDSCKECDNKGTMVCLSCQRQTIARPSNFAPKRKATSEDVFIEINFGKGVSRKYQMSEDIVKLLREGEDIRIVTCHPVYGEKLCIGWSKK